MSLIKCSECGHLMSDTAGKCPNCGYRLRKINIKILYAIILLVIGIGALLFSEFLLIMSMNRTGCYIYECVEFICATILYIFVIGCGIYSAIIFSKYNKTVKNIIMGLIVIAVLVLICRFTIYPGLISWDEARQIRNEREGSLYEVNDTSYNNEEQYEHSTEVILQDCSSKAKVGWDYLLSNLKDKGTNLEQVQEQMKDASSITNIPNTSVVVYTVKDKSKRYLAWVFFKGDTPKSICLSDMGEYPSEGSLKKAIVLLL